MSERIPPLDLAAQYQDLQDEIDAAIHRVLSSGRYILGPEVEALEHEIAALCGVRYGVGVASGTDALLLILLALGIGPGDEVITTPFSFIATAAAISRTGARPVFVDIEPDTYNLDPCLVEEAITQKTRALLPVHLYGQPADMTRLRDICREWGLYLVEDACQALGASYYGRPVGSLGDAAAISFYPTKNLGGAGDGGMVVTDNPDLAAGVDLLRRQGSREKYHAEVLGVNSRLDELQAAILRVKLPYLDRWNELRRDLAWRYGYGLRKLPVVLPVVEPGANPVFHQYTIRVMDGQRDALLAHLQRAGIGAQVYYPVPIHLQRIYEVSHYREHFPEAERAAGEVLSLPIYPEMTEGQVARICAEIRGFYGD